MSKISEFSRWWRKHGMLEGNRSVIKLVRSYAQLAFIAGITSGKYNRVYKQFDNPEPASTIDKHEPKIILEKVKQR